MFRFLLALLDIYRVATLTGAEYARRRGVKLGENCDIHTYKWGSEPFLIEIGNNVIISYNVMMITHDESTALIADQNGRRFHIAPIKIGNNVFIGAGSIILPGTIIGNNVIIGAGSVVTKNIPDNVVVAGNPAKFICSFDSYHQNKLSLPSDTSLKAKGHEAWATSIACKSSRPFIDIP